MGLSRTDCAMKVSSGDGGAILEDVPHLTDWLPDLPVSIVKVEEMDPCTAGADVKRDATRCMVLLVGSFFLLINVCRVTMSLQVFSDQEKSESLGLCMHVDYLIVEALLVCLSVSFPYLDM